METEGSKMMPNIVPSESETPVSLKHVDSQFCWCEPAVEWIGEDGKQIVVHREVVWN